MQAAAEIMREMTERQRADPEALWWPGASDVLRWTSSDLHAVGPLYEEIAELVARGYDGGDLSFDLCDGIVIGLFAAFIELGLTDVPHLYYDVFLAFDEGEYRRDTDDAAVDPVRKYTDPRIKDIVAKL
jgi:hypothetical protein